MPMYEYRCKECGSTFDVNMTMGEKARRQQTHEITCENCGSAELEQIFGGISILSGAAVGAKPSNGSCCSDGGSSCCG